MTSQKPQQTTSGTPSAAPPAPAAKPAYAIAAGLAALLMVALLIGIKSYAYLQSGSLSVLASLVDSIVDSGVSLMNLLVILYAIRPADRDHRYGHGKAEGLAALAQGLFIAGAALYLLSEAATRFLHQEAVSDHGLAIAVMGVSVILSYALVRFQSYALRRAPSLAIEADQAHYSMDIAVNSGVIVTIIMIYYGAPGWIDPLFALGVAAYLAYVAWHIGRKGLDMLLDRELPEPDRQTILTLARQDKDVLGVHDLRTRKSGMAVHIFFDVELDPKLSLESAHSITTRIERTLLQHFPNAEIMIHMDPYGQPEDASRHASFKSEAFKKDDPPPKKAKKKRKT